ncbi:MAG: hypothetical protein PHE27_08490 [Alphaproteobacteria bacterium]|nr:hypothetical protein [Alphaproteobacteria bacterium]
MTPQGYISFEIDPDKYDKTIQELVSRTTQLCASTPDAETVAAWRAFYVAALSKGVALALLPRQIAGKSVEDILDAARWLPDKEGRSWISGFSGLTPEDRKAFSEAGERRKPKVRWEAFFKNGQTDIVLPLVPDAQSYADRIAAFIRRHNEDAIKNFSEERALDLALKRDRPRAGSGIDQLLIRRDPVNPSQIQVCKPDLRDGTVGAPNDWKPGGPKLGRYLESCNEWALADVFHAETGGRKNDMPVSAAADFVDMAHGHPVDADSLGLGRLRLVITNDPQKIGEMSTGQRWTTCMVKDGPCFDQTLADIEAGVLAAFVVDVDDPQARYPLMRVLIKPFWTEKTACDAIFVPAKIYGGDGPENSRTCDALERTLARFVALQNANKSGFFVMDPRLYVDSQVQLVCLEKQWAHDGIVESMERYQRCSLKDWLFELAATGVSDDKALRKRKSLKNSIALVFDADDSVHGLPRKFYREVSKTFVGAIPQPLEILEAARDGVFINRKAAFGALKKGDLPLWAELSKNWEPDVRYLAAYAALASSKPGDGSPLAALSSAYGAEMKDLLDRAAKTASIRKNPSRLNASLIERLGELASMAGEYDGVVDAGLVERVSLVSRADVSFGVREAASRTLSSLLVPRPDLVSAARSDSLAGRARRALERGVHRFVFR